MKKIVALIILAVILITSCKDKSPMLPNVSGRAGEVILVIDNDLWSTNIGNQFKTYLTIDYPGLPQSEPLFDLIQLPTQAFTNIFKTHRNIIIVRISDEYKEPKVVIQKNVYAKPQIVINVIAPNKTVLENLISEKGNIIVDRLLQMETSRYGDNYFKYKERGVSEKIAGKFGVEIDFPKGYTIDMDTLDFAWVSNDSPSMAQAMLVFSYKLPKVELTTPYLVAKRNEFTKRFVAGNNPNSYMTIESEFEPLRREIEVNKIKVIELRGLWRVEGDFMGGPFVTFIIKDEKNDRVIHLDGFVYAPQFDKRDYVRQLEAILHSIKLN